MIAWVSRPGPVVVQAVKDFTVTTVQKAAELAVRAGSQLFTDSASSYRAVQGYVHAYVNHTHSDPTKESRFFSLAVNAKNPMQNQWLDTEIA